MKNSKQFRSGVNGKSGQEVAKHSFGKTDVRYWYDAIFKPEYRRDGQKLKVEDWAARIQWRGRRETFNLKTSNKAAAAAKAKDVSSFVFFRFSFPRLMMETGNDLRKGADAILATICVEFPVNDE